MAQIKGDLVQIMEYGSISQLEAFMYLSTLVSFL